MPTLSLQGTTFTFSVLPNKKKGKVCTKIAVQNEYISYEEMGENVSVEEIEELLTSLSRFLAGAYKREYTLSFEQAGISVDLYPYAEEGKILSRELLREKDSVMALRLLMRSKDKKQFLGGVYTLLFHKEEIKEFVTKLRVEYAENCVRRVHGREKYRFVGVSPFGFVGCEYLYLDEIGDIQAGDYVWARMGRHNLEQIVYVDSVHYFNDKDVPYNPKTVKKVLRKATPEEIK